MKTMHMSLSKTSLTYGLREPDESWDVGLRNIRVVRLSVDEVDEVLVLKEWSCNCATAIVHVTHVFVKTRQVFYKILNLPYRVINN